jgi:predicted XRE-type DNA-binding protein
MGHDEENSIEVSCGNIFADLDFPDAEVHQAKVYLTICIEQEMKARKLSQTEAAQIMGIGQPKLSTLLKGHVRNCSIDRLIRYLSRLDQEVEITVKRRAIG